MPVPPKLKGRLSAAPEPLWRGPLEDGVTYSMLSRFLSCPRRFKVHVIDGLGPIDTFNHRIEYGHMWHLADEVASKNGDWREAVQGYAANLCRRYPLSQKEALHWAQVCTLQYSIYRESYQTELKTDRVEVKKTLDAEVVFSSLYKTENGTQVRLRGKMDAILLGTISGAKGLSLLLKESKTKSTIDAIGIDRQLRFDLQTMLYLVVIETLLENKKLTTGLVKPKIGGVYYSVVKRPLSGGKGSIVKHKPTKKNPKGESDAEFYGRLEEIIRENKSEFFAEWVVPIYPEDVLKFRMDFLDPTLDRLSYWYDVVTGKKPDLAGVYYRHPYGVTNILDEGGHTDLDAYLDEGQLTGLTSIELFKELK